ncbi:MAG: hypothetical protein QOH44_621, partial [Actinomycetota bacterium]|nr:hypothetical protein [Actinomycetota bacterium]
MQFKIAWCVDHIEHNAGDVIAATRGERGIHERVRRLSRRQS